MSSFRILHVDDDPDIRNIVNLSLSLDPALTVKSCASGDEVFEIASEWNPDLILCDVRMPAVDGLAVLTRLRDSTSTSNIPFVFLTGSSQPCELERLRLLGAAAVVIRPLDPTKLADTVRRHLRPTGLATAGESFVRRLHRDAAQLALWRENLRDEPNSSTVREDLLACSHKLAGAAGIFGFQAISHGASTLEESILAQRAGLGTPGMVEVELDALLECLKRQFERT